MRNIVLHVAVTLDGFIEGPNGELDWLVRDETIDFADILSEILNDKDAIFYGRVSYEKWGRFEPGEDAGEKLRRAYAALHSKQKYVFSREASGDGTDATYITSEVERRVTEIKAEPGRNIWLYGGGKLITTFLNLDLIDEYKLAVHPVIIGSGKRLFEDVEAYHKLTLVEAKPHPSGVMLVHYRQKEQSDRSHN